MKIPGLLILDQIFYHGIHAWGIMGTLALLLLCFWLTPIKFLSCQVLLPLPAHFSALREIEAERSKVKAENCIDRGKSQELSH